MPLGPGAWGRHSKVGAGVWFACKTQQGAIWEAGVSGKGRELVGA